MKTVRHVTFTLLVCALCAAPRAAQAQQPDPIRDELMMQFQTSMSKFIALAKEFPADRYAWAPTDDVMEVGQVLMHVARYNYMYPSANMGVAPPSGVDLGSMESVRDRDQVIRALEQSRDYVRTVVAAMSPADLAGQTRLYGRDVQKYAVLVQLVSHMNEHLGQSISYARMSGIVPPWSR